MPLDFAFTDEHDELRATVRAFLAEHSDEKSVRAQMASERGYDREVWTLLAEQLGLAGLIIPEVHGGAGMGYVELLVAMEEMGRALLCAPYLGTSVLAANALLHCADAAAQKELLAEIAAGRKIVSLAHAEPNGRWDVAGIAMRARAKGDGFELDGTKAWVLDGHAADVLLVVARTEQGLGLFRVDARAEGLTRTLVPTLDTTRKLATVELAATPARLVSRGDQAANLERVFALTVAALAAEQVGGAQRCLEMATDFAKTRLQFGRPIGSYQAIKHKCADMLVAVEFAKSAAYAACFAAADGDADGAELLESAALAKAYCSEAYYRVAAENIQIHGGMGFTWEHPAHLYFKRAKASDLLFGDAAHHRDKLAECLGI
jgi:alkylation response protein AidB-like acyl-CoA dehydrogenase